MALLLRLGVRKGSSVVLTARSIGVWRGPAGSQQHQQRRRPVQQHSIFHGLEGQRTRSFASSASRGASDPYSTLGLDRNASQEDIKRAYRQQALKWHPDRVPPESRAEAEKRFSDIANAYEILSDPAKKRQFDTYGAHGSPGQAPPGGSYGGGYGPGGFPPGGGVHSADSAEKLFREVFGSGDLESIFGQFFDQVPSGQKLRVGSEVQVLSKFDTVVRACRESGIDSTNDGLRRRAVGRKGKVIKVDTADRSVKVHIDGIGDVWFGARAVRPAPGAAPPNGPGGFFGAGPSGLGSFFSGNFPSGGVGVGGTVVSQSQQLVRGRDGRQKLVITRTIRRPDGSMVEETVEQDM